MLKRACATLLVAVLLGAVLLAYGRVGEAHPRPAPVAQERPTLPPERPTLAPDATVEPIDQEDGDEEDTEEDEAVDEDTEEDEAADEEEADDAAPDEATDAETADETDAEAADEVDAAENPSGELPKAGGNSRSLALLAALAVGLLALGLRLRAMPPTLR